jgi:hypothetical protein
MTTNIPVARCFILRSWRSRSRWRFIGGVDDAEPGTLLIPDVVGDAESGGDASVVRASSMACGS